MRWNMRVRLMMFAAAAVFGVMSMTAQAQVAVRGKVIYTMDTAPIMDGVVVMRDGKIAAVGPAATTPIPDGFRVLEAEIVTPGLIDAHSTVGVSGIYNSPHDQDQLDRSTAIQPELRAIDVYNPLDKLVEYVRGFGITTVHTGHAPGELISGQTCIVKTVGTTVEEAVLVPTAAVAATLGPDATKSGGKSPGTRGKMVAMLRAEFIKAQEYLEKLEKAKDDQPPARDLKLEMLGRVLKREIPLMVTANRAQDIAGALRLAEEFNIRLWLDSAAEAYLLTEQIKAANVPVIIHPTMRRAFGETENLSFETAAKLREARIPIAMQSGYEGYVPKTRIVLFEAGVAVANGLPHSDALASITIEAARLLGVADRIGSITVGKDGDLALFDGDPFEYTTHCVGTIINGQVVSDTPQ